MMLLPTLAPRTSHRQSVLTWVKPTRQFYNPKANLSAVSVAEASKFTFTSHLCMMDQCSGKRKITAADWGRNTHNRSSREPGHTDGDKSPTCFSPFLLWIHTSKKLKAVQQHLLQHIRSISTLCYFYSNHTTTWRMFSVILWLFKCKSSNVIFKSVACISHWLSAHCTNVADKNKGSFHRWKQILAECDVIYFILLVDTWIILLTNVISLPVLSPAISGFQLDPSASIAFWFWYSHPLYRHFVHIRRNISQIY